MTWLNQELDVWPVQRTFAGEISTVPYDTLDVT